MAPATPVPPAVTVPRRVWVAGAATRTTFAVWLAVLRSTTVALGEGPVAAVGLVGVAAALVWIQSL